MLSQRIEQWAEGYLAAGRMEGRMEGRVEGRVEGRMEGRLEGEIGVLTRLLSRRFGPLPTWAETRLNAATEQALADWTDAVLDAARLTDVLGPPPADH